MRLRLLLTAGLLAGLLATGAYVSGALDALENASIDKRFEVYVAGLELCNAFGELTDAVEQRQRLETDLGERRRRGLPEYPIDEQFLAAVAQLPLTSGIAVGVDRLAMLLLGAREIRDVMPFMFDEL